MAWLTVCPTVLFILLMVMGEFLLGQPFAQIMLSCGERNVSILDWILEVFGTETVRVWGPEIPLVSSELILL